MPRGFPDLPPVWALGAAVAAWALARWLPLVALPGGMGRILMGVGIALILWAALWFLRKRTPIEPNHAPRALIVEGPYRINRNPIYTGLVLVLLGWGLWLGALSALAPAAVFAAVVDRRFVRSEEAALLSAFGSEAERYFAATRRW